MRRPGTAARLVVGLEGTHVEVDWMAATLAEEWRGLGVTSSSVLVDADAENLWRRLVECPAQPGSPLVIKATLRSSEVTRFIVAVREIDPQASIQAHAGNGDRARSVRAARAGAVSKKLLGQLYPLATSCGGHVDGAIRRAGRRIHPPSRLLRQRPAARSDAERQTPIRPRQYPQPRAVRILNVGATFEERGHDLAGTYHR